MRNRCNSILRKKLDTQIPDPEPDETESGNETTAQQAEYAFLVQTIRALPPAYADVLYFALVQEMPAAKIAKLLGLTPAAVRKRISRGREMLQKELGEDFYR